MKSLYYIKRGEHLVRYRGKEKKGESGVNKKKYYCNGLIYLAFVFKQHWEAKNDQ